MFRLNLRVVTVIFTFNLVNFASFVLLKKYFFQYLQKKKIYFGGGGSEVAINLFIILIVSP